MFAEMLTLLLILVPLFHQGSSSPVLLWSNANLPRSDVSLSALSPLNVLSDSICQLSDAKIQLRLFAVYDLTIEDIQRGPQSQHPILLDAKKEGSAFRYFPNIADDVHKTFSLIPRSNNMKCSHIQFQLASSDIYPTVHDALNAMQASIKSIGSDTSNTVVMAFIPGPGPRQLSVRSLEKVEIAADVLISDDQSCMFYAKQLFWGDADRRNASALNHTLDISRSSCISNSTNSTNGTSHSAILDLVWTTGLNDTGFENETRMNIFVSIIGLYWRLIKAEVNGGEYRYFAYGMHSEMETPPTFSYACTSAVFVRYNSSGKYGTYNFTDKFYISNLQFQPFFANGTYFGPPNYCTSFFTSGIWMGITSSLLCFAILLFGVHRMMSIKSNDRFDDPRGKPLVIKAQE